MPISWDRRLFIDNAAIYQPVLESGLKKAPSEVQGLIRQFQRFKVPRYGRVLDVSCGIGRHSIYLAKHGYNVVGIDPSPTFLRRARQLMRRKRVPKRRIRFYSGKLPAITSVLQSNGEEPFDAIISMDYSFGYSNREADLQLFRDLHRSAKTGCAFVIETGNKDFWLKHGPRYFRESFPPRLERFIAFHFDSKNDLLKSEWEFYRKVEGKDLKHLLSVRVKASIYSRASLVRQLKDTGWRPVTAFENIQHPRTLSDQLPYFFTVALKM